MDLDLAILDSLDLIVPLLSRSRIKEQNQFERAGWAGIA